MLLPMEMLILAHYCFHPLLKQGGVGAQNRVKNRYECVEYMRKTI